MKLVAIQILLATCLASPPLFSGVDTVTSVPLTTPEGSASTVFRKMPSAETGINFTNHLDPVNNIPFINTGAGVAVADFDGDGLTDIYLLSTDSPNALFRQTAPFVFQDVTATAGVGGGQVWSRGATFADVDNDGDLDLYVCNTEAPNLLYVNQGNGRFSEAAAAFGLDVSAASIMAYFADYDRDGDLDMYLVTYRVLAHNLLDGQIADVRVPAGSVKTIAEMKVKPAPPEKNASPDVIDREHWDNSRGKWEISGQIDRLFRNNGNQTFSDVTEQAGLLDYGLGLSATWMDFDGDGWLDLYVGNDLNTRDRLYRNNSNGTFTNVLPYIIPHTPWYSMGADFADINNDGLFDFFVADMAGSTHYRAKVSMGSISDKRYFLTHEWPRQKMQNALFLNTGQPRYLEISAMCGLAATDWTWSVKFGDLDNDGWVDLFTTNGTARDDMNVDIMSSKTNEIWNRDGEQAALNYLKTIPSAPSPDFVFRNRGNLKFESVSAQWGLNHDGISYGAAYADFDRDGDLDLVVNHLGEPAGLYQNMGRSGNRLLLRLKGVGSNRWGYGSKVKITTSAGQQVRVLLPARGFMSSDEPLVHFGLGDAKRVDHLEITWPDGGLQIIENLAVNRLYTITEDPKGKAQAAMPDPRNWQFQEVTQASGLRWRHQEINHDDYAAQPLLPSKLSQLGPGLAWADANGDGFDDLYLSGAAGQPGSLFLRAQRGFKQVDSGTWQNHQGQEDMAPLWFDVDSDGDQDLFVSSGSYEHPPGDIRLRDRLYLNDGKGTLTPAPADSLPEDLHFSGSTVAADFDSDGDLDLFVGSRAVPGQYPISPISRLLLNTDGRFSDVTQDLAPQLRKVGLVTAALWTDVDADGKPDLLVCLEWGPVKYFHNEGGRLVDATQASGLAKRSGWWSGITGGDFNNDGHMDYAVMNNGLNSKYKASPDKPARIYYGEMDGSGKPHLIEAKVAEEGLLPVRGRSCSSSAMPFVTEKFPTYHDYASALLPDIYTPSTLEKAQMFSATELKSGLLLGDGKGHFRWRALPRLVQASPGFGVVAADYNGDGHLDLYTVQNFFTREPETGLLDGGISAMLWGNGTGDFTHAKATKTGLVVPGDGMGLTSIDLDRNGWPDIVLTQNAGPMMTFLNRGIKGRDSLAIRLQGRPGNLTAVGARVTAVGKDGRRRSVEIYAGSGYLSQSTQTVFFGQNNGAATQSIEVRWPNGETTKHVPEKPSGWIVIRWLGT